MVKEQSIRVGMTVFSFVCLVGIGIYLAQFLWLALAGVNQPEIQLTLNSAPETDVSTKAVNIREIQQWHLFGAPAKKPVLQDQPVEAPKTTLKLELLGVFLGQDGALSTAIIGEIGKTADYYKEGDTIARGVVLKEVFENKVILSRNGRYETLAFSETSNEGFQPTSVGTNSRASKENFRESRRNFLRRSARSTNRRGAVAAPESQLGKMVQSGRAYAPDKIIDALKQDLSENPQAALKDMGLVADASGGAYVIGSNAPRDLMSTMGLRVGDRIMTVDGQPVSGGSSDSALIQAAMQNPNIRVEIQRGTRTFTVNVPVPK